MFSALKIKKNNLLCFLYTYYIYKKLVTEILGMQVLCLRATERA